MRIEVDTDCTGGLYPPTILNHLFYAAGEARRYKVHMKTIYKNRLPHIAPIGATFFVTFRLADALPAAIVRDLKIAYNEKCKQILQEKPANYQQPLRDERKRYFGRFDHQLDEFRYGQCYLQQPAVAELVAQRLKQYDHRYYDLQTYCIMPNHVHLLIDTMEQLKIADDEYAEEIPENYSQLDRLMRLIKGGSAKQINTILNREGVFWMKDSYDHYVRNPPEWGRILNYILNNPVKAGLVKDWSDWKFSYCKYNLE